MLSAHDELSRFERLLTLVTRVRPGEGRAAFLFFLHGFLLLSSYQVVKALREAFMLTKFSAETARTRSRSIALVLMLLMPAYGWLRRRLDGARLLRGVTLFFVVTMPLFAVLARAGVSIAFAFFIWVSIYGVPGRVADVGLRGRLVQRQERPAPVRRDHARRQLVRSSAPGSRRSRWTRSHPSA